MSDSDGFTSAAIIYKYIYINRGKDNLYYIVREGKKHGLDDEVYEFVKSNNINLLIVPDAQCEVSRAIKIINELECDILVLDHHDTPQVCLESNMCIINPNYIQDQTYPNKNLSGCAVTYKFIQALDDYYFTDSSSQCTDLVALSLISDSVSIIEFENKYLVSKGISNVKNEFMLSLIKAQSYSLGTDKLVANDYSWYIVPLINATIRIGKMEELEVVFKAFCELYEEFPYKKRGSSETTLEDVYTKASRLCVNAKSRQTRIRDKDMQFVENIIKDNSLDKHKLLIINTENKINTNLTGLTAMKVADKYKKPVCLVNNYHDDVLGGSARNFHDSYIEDLKGYLQDSNLFELTAGHPSAFGVNIKEENIQKVLDKADKDFDNIETKKCYNIDYELKYEELNINLFNDMDDFNKYVVNDIQEPLVLIKNVVICLSNTITMGGNANNWKYDTDIDDIKIIKFKCDGSDFILDKLSEMSEENILVNIIGKLKFNNYEGIYTPQVIIEDYEVVKVLEDEFNIDDNNSSPVDTEWEEW